MLGRENVSAIINVIVDELNACLNKHSPIFLNETQFKASNYPHSVKCDDGSYIAFAAKIKNHNTDLTLQRKKNIYDICYLINKQLTLIVDDKKDDLGKRIVIIQRLLEIGKAKNKQIANAFRVSNVNYKESRLAGNGFFASLKKVRLTGSRSNRAFTNALSLLEDFKHKFGINIPSLSDLSESLASLEQLLSAPPAYSAPHSDVPIAHSAPVMKI